MIDVFYDLISDRKPVANVGKIRCDEEFYIVLCKPISRMTAISKTAAFILSCCNGKKDINDIVTDLSRIFRNEERLKLKKDVIHSLREFEDLGLIKRYEF